MGESTETPADYLIAQAYAFWRTKGSSVTVVRKIICEVALRAEDAFDAETLLARCRCEDSQISLSTVYRTLGHLVEARVLHEVQGVGEKKCYAPATSQYAGQSHVVCQDCKQVFPLEDPCLVLREGALARKQGFSPKNVSLRLEASCDQLNELGICDRKKNGSDKGAKSGQGS
ncbi:transcriptional repressor [Ruficoccus amylovorans]|uniref:Ferric uptake regulation protein n=1 Tax=Ruficoccus amylovorans TaxID=1804625 RepID=A0A842HDI5_9BACT|nr:transcriptional repressor [Ruficoccus amylovorans]MBC2593604.1 transcriptional repressor [Ruficoccus amylovorans]